MLGFGFLTIGCSGSLLPLLLALTGSIASAADASFSFSSPPSSRSRFPVARLGYATYQGLYNDTYDLNVWKRYVLPPPLCRLLRREGVMLAAEPLMKNNGKSLLLIPVVFVLEGIAGWQYTYPLELPLSARCMLPHGAGKTTICCRPLTSSSLFSLSSPQ